MQNISDILNLTTKKLQMLENPRFEAEVLLCAVLKVERVFLKINNKKILTKLEENKFFEYIDLRVKNIPVAYILGYKYWSDFKILVDKNTLIPRDETEILCQYVLEKNKNSKKIKILDIGTGSGCISIFMKKKFLESEVLGLDISEKALRVAQKNAENQKLKINFLKSDMLEKIQKNSFFDIIIANLPYVPKNIKITPEVELEPYSAIFSKDNGLFHIQKLQEEILNKNIKFNQLWLEFLPQQKEDIKNIFKDFKVEFFGDVSGEIFFACVS